MLVQLAAILYRPAAEDDSERRVARGSKTPRKRGLTERCGSFLARLFASTEWAFEDRLGRIRRERHGAKKHYRLEQRWGGSPPEARQGRSGPRPRRRAADWNSQRRFASDQQRSIESRADGGRWFILATSLVGNLFPVFREAASEVES
jgi:hypothetical protein